MARPRRIVRKAPAVRGLGTIAQSISRTMGQRNTGYSNPRPATIPQGAFSRPGPITPITGGYAAVTLDFSGGGRAFCGPQGVGTVWYPQAVAVATTSGAGDNSTVSLFISPMLSHDLNGLLFVQELQMQIGGQSYAGGGDTIGIAVPPMRNGYYIICIWSGGTENDLASFQVYGNQTVLMA